MQNKSQVAGILSIISGVFAVLGAGWLFVAIFFFRFLLNQTIPLDEQMPQAVFTIMAAFYGIIGFVLFLIGALAIGGGIFALRRKNWGLALAGAITATIAFFPTGIAAVILIAIGQQEFAPTRPVAPGSL
jgi:hypothetical protein